MKNSTKKQNSKKFKKGVVFEAKKPKVKSPSISRSFTDKKFLAPLASSHKQAGSKENPNIKRLRTIILNKYFLVSFVTTFLGVALTMQGISVQKSLQKLQEIRQDRVKIEREVVYWEKVSQDHPGYRDAYFKLALLEYQLGNKDKARFYVEKTLELDPNYTPARDFRQEVGIPYSL